MEAGEELAYRVTYERERRGWSYEDTAAALARHGLEIHFTAVYKIEKRGRRVTVDELVALASAFETTPGDLLRPVAEVADEEASALVRELIDADAEVERVAARLLDVARRLQEMSQRHGINGLDRLVSELEGAPETPTLQDQPQELRDYLSGLVPLIWKAASRGER